MKKLIWSVIMILVVITLAACESVPIEGDVIITLNPGVDTVDINSTFEDAGATAKIASRSVTVRVIENTVDLETLGTYRIVYEATYNNVDYQAVRYVNVIDETPPIMTLNPGVDTVYVGDAWEDSGVTVSDNSGESITYVTEGDVDTNVAGQYIVTYRASDASDNTTEINRIVVVVDQADVE